MKVQKERYSEVINALDGIRCDNRENRQYNEDENKLRPLTQDIMQYIERKGYCKYIYGANGRFVRTLTEKGYEVLQYMDYAKYKKQKAVVNWKTWIPIVISGIALIISGYAALVKPEKPNSLTIEEWNKVVQLDSSLKSLKDLINSLNLRMSKAQNSTKDFSKEPR